ncbi:ciliogenesis-associated TTC17-interacting protein-like isoform X2 [Belonocnema kinseyi]|uniref:ciliogenesis-associated TTC17-interacting protein-like isoform X2 n=1 Tax=Belonocnema kinseyi TaxID=2817044 RepID=UPI00143CF662|nr:ciliogenesis-associated TTC17-interacting protein-like isoform X2 [Belonocnema kinseyi]
MNYNNSSQEIYIIKRIIQEEFNLEQNTITYMTKTGRILKHDWLEVSYMLKINPLSYLNKMKNEEMPEKVPLRGSWVEDIELNCKMAKTAEYLTDHPELKNMIADYVQALLFVKPGKVLPFTIQHFLAFANETEPTEFSSKLEDIGPQVFKLFGNLDLKLDRRDISRSKEAGELPTPTCPACSVCSSSSSQISTKMSEHIFENTDDSQISAESETHERENFEKNSKSKKSSSDFEFRFED